MGRNIVPQRTRTTQELPESSTPVTPDNYASQIVKLIPTEIVGVYLGLQNLFSSVTNPTQAFVQGILFLVILGITPFYLKSVAGITDSKQRTVSILSYFIWGISLGGPFEYGLTMIHSPVSAQMIGGALIMLYTLIVPLVYKANPSSTT